MIGVFSLKISELVSNFFKYFNYCFIGVLTKARCENSKINKLSNDNSQTGKFLIDNLHLEYVTVKTV